MIASKFKRNLVFYVFEIPRILHTIILLSIRTYRSEKRYFFLRTTPMTKDQLEDSFAEIKIRKTL